MMKTCLRSMVILGFVFMFGFSVQTMASGHSHKGKSITLGWAAWDPANALVELSKDFTKKTGIKVNFEFVPWPNFADRMLNELNQGGKTFDVMIGDSQWIGGGAESGHYVKLNSFFDKEGIDMNDFLEPAVEGYSTWPKGTPNYYALPAFGDANAWVYRKDWFERPNLQKAFKQKYGYDLDAPKNWTQLMDIAKFFHGRTIDGKKRYGLAIFTERGSEGITMGATSALYAWGFQYQDPYKPYHLNGFTNSARAVEALEFYKELYNCCTPPGHSDAYMSANLDAYDSGQVAMQMNWYAFFPGINKSDNVGSGKTGFFSNPDQVTSGATLGGQGMSVIAYSNKQDLALEYIKWFATPEVQKRWWALGGYSVHKEVLNDPNFVKSAPYAKGFLDSMQKVNDFWQEPNFQELILPMQKRLHDYIVGNRGTAKDALDRLVKDWNEVFEDSGKL